MSTSSDSEKSPHEIVAEAKAAIRFIPNPLLENKQVRQHIAKGIVGEAWRSSRYAEATSCSHPAAKEIEYLCKSIAAQIEQNIVYPGKTYEECRAKKVPGDKLSAYTTPASPMEEYSIILARTALTAKDFDTVIKHRSNVTELHRKQLALLAPTFAEYRHLASQANSPITNADRINIQLKLKNLFEYLNQLITQLMQHPGLSTKELQSLVKDLTKRLAEMTPRDGIFAETTKHSGAWKSRQGFLKSYLCLIDKAKYSLEKNPPEQVAIFQSYARLQLTKPQPNPEKKHVKKPSPLVLKLDESALISTTSSSATPSSPSAEIDLSASEKINVSGSRSRIQLSSEDSRLSPPSLSTSSSATFRLTPSQLKFTTFPPPSSVSPSAVGQSQSGQRPSISEALESSGLSRP